MPAYVLATIKVTDPEAYKLYTAETPAVIAQFGGRFVVRGGNPTALEGDWSQNRIVVLAFKDRATAEAWYRSPAYQKILPLRLAASEGRSALLDGLPSPPAAPGQEPPAGGPAPGFVLATIRVEDAEAYKLYAAQVPPTLAAFGARPLIAGGSLTALEGDWPQDRVVLLGFKDRATAEAWYRSPAYRELIPLRRAAAKSSLALLEGFVAP